jgi:hypothetical protein
METVHSNDSQWHWQEPGTAWRGVGVYHVTLTVPSREPLLGTLVIPGNDPSRARVERTALGNAVVDELYVMCRRYSEIRILQFCLMPDHLHFVIHVTRVMQASIRSVIRGYWQGVKKLGRAYTLSLSPELNSGLADKAAAMGAVDKAASIGPTGKAAMGPAEAGSGGYAFPVFTERPFIRPLSRRGQLQTMFRYVQMNPQRLATKWLFPGFFRVQKDIEIAGRRYDGVGNAVLLHAGCYMPVHVRRTMVEMAAHGDSKPLRDYYKPAGCLFEACAADRVLILSPWSYDAGKRHISRADCVTLNGMAEEIATQCQ